MDRSAAYGGIVGEVVVPFIGFRTVVACLPLIVALAVMALVGVLTQLPAAVPALFGAFFVAYAIGTTGLAAREGNFEAGIGPGAAPRGQVFGFILRFGVLLIIGMAPVALIAYVAGPHLGFNVGLGAGVSFAPALTVFVAAAMACACNYALIVAVATDSLREALSPSWLAWLFGARRRDLWIYFAAALGGALLFAVMILPWLFALAGVVAHVSIEAGLVIGGFVYMEESVARLSKRVEMATVSARGADEAS